MASLFRWRNPGVCGMDVLQAATQYPLTVLSICFYYSTLREQLAYKKSCPRYIAMDHSSVSWFQYQDHCCQVTGLFAVGNSATASPAVAVKADRG